MFIDIFLWFSVKKLFLFIVTSYIWYFKKWFTWHNTVMFTDVMPYARLGCPFKLLLHDRLGLVYQWTCFVLVCRETITWAPNHPGSFFENALPILPWAANTCGLYWLICNVIKVFRLEGIPKARALTSNFVYYL